MISDHHPLGTSTGAVGRGTDWDQLVRDACAVSTHAVELAAHDPAELSSLVAFLDGRPRLPFRCVSVHAPTRGGGSDAERVAALGALPVWVPTIIAHPELIVDPAPWRTLGRRLVLENMDARKSGGRTVAELAPLMAALPEAGFCLDVAHAHTVDPTMRLAAELLDAFRGRLREVHLSSIRGGAHITLTAEDERAFAPHLARCRDVPWILEAPVPAHWLTAAPIALAA